MNELDTCKNSSKKTVDVLPLTKWKRILVYLCDLVIVFFAAWLLNSVVALPIGKAASGYEDHLKIAEKAAMDREDVLYGNKLLFYKPETDKYDFDEAIKYTALAFTKHFVYDNDTSFNQYDVFKTYFIDIKNDKSAYLDILKERDAKYGFFDFSHDMPVLKDKYKEQFKPSLPNETNPDSNSKEGERNFNIFQNEIFASSYSVITDDIMKNDLTFEGKSFVASQTIVANQTQYVDVLVIVSSFISMFISGIIFFLVIPLCNQNGKTCSMMMMRVERVGVSNIFLLPKSQVALISVYHFVSCLGVILFIPLPSVNIAYVFRLAPILFVALTAMAICLVSFIFLMFNGYNRTLFDYLSRTAMISTDSLDEIYRSKGYGI